ncbi:MAG: twin-arginine translocase subunit TatC [archaeon]|nr:twin-arginine translocase subunit TatC [archaeon]MCP8314482.1 twin-arginine translocase subunit TatC [archaeon]MCP8319441.1 twin-arginine translocase subunit TatC [archaeon]
MSKEMGLLDHIDELRARVVRILISVVAITLFTFLFGIKEFMYGDLKIYLPFPDVYNNISAQFIERIKEDLLPSYVQLIVTSPGQALLAQFSASIFLGVIFSMPIIVYQIGKFVNPALYPSERRTILKIIVPATILFSLGCIFSYILVTPFTLDFLYRYGIALGAQTFVTIDDFISFVLLFTLAFGLSFQLPIIMVMVTSLGVVDVEFWKKNFSYALVAIVIFGAIITPDTSGITMWFVAIPMIILYVIGYLFIRRKVKVKP